MTMRRISALFTTIVLLVLLLAACSKPLNNLSAEDMLNLGEKYLLEMDYEQAAVYFEQLIEVEPMNPRGYLGAAEAYIGQRDYFSAINALRSCTEQVTDDDTLRDVARSYEDILKKAPETASAYIGLANLYVLIGDEAAAVEVLRRGAEYLPDNDRIAAMLESIAGPETVEIPGMPVEFWFSSGAGGWGTFVTVQSDGSFAGEYYDSDMGSTGAGYPNGKHYECIFGGAFTDIQKVSDYEYSMTVERLDVEGTVGEEKIVDGVLVITTECYGLGEGDRVLLYLPGRRTDNLPEMFLNWVHMPMGSDVPSVLPFFGIYNIDYEVGFFSAEVENETPPEPVETAPIMPEPVDPLAAMTRSEYAALNEFMSAFPEVWLYEFDAGNYSDERLIEFAIWHIYRNAPASMLYVYTENYDIRIEASTIAYLIDDFFGIRVAHQSAGYIDNPNYWNYEEYTYLYEDGYYYFNGADGEAPHWAQVTELAENRDGTLTAQLDTYAGHYPPDNMYDDIDDWNKDPATVLRKGESRDYSDGHDPAEDVYYSGSFTAVIRPQDGSYKLVSLRQAQ